MESFLEICPFQSTSIQSFGEQAVPDDFQNPLRGWEAIRQALIFIEGLSTFSLHALAGVEIYQQTEVSNARVYVRTLEELDNYLRPIFERMYLDIELDFIPLTHEIDILNEVLGRIVLDYPYDVNRSLGTMP
ncbi:MAG: hypothetical protein ACFFEK_09580 [Candidatus Thorarchaeota archaeon]